MEAPGGRGLGAGKTLPFYLIGWISRSGLNMRLQRFEVACFPERETRALWSRGAEPHGEQPRLFLFREIEELAGADRRARWPLGAKRDGVDRARAGYTVPDQVKKDGHTGEYFSL